MKIVLINGESILLCNEKINSIVGDNKNVISFDMNGCSMEDVLLEAGYFSMFEEEKFIKESDYVWVCDPIDGTGMYVNHVPVFVFSLALVYHGEPIVGVVYNPSEDKLYTAIKNEGAYCNDIKIHVNNKKLGDLGYKTNVEIFNNDIIDEVSLIKELKSTSKFSSIGSVARSSMAIAEGAFSCDIFPGTKHGNCDIAASYLIVTEAGGKVTDLYGEEQRYDKAIKGAIISNGISHEEILKIVKKYVLK